ncbi:MAG: PEP-CTERM sorting domain-containing protein [Cyanophyceae cyanobacterium]
MLVTVAFNKAIAASLGGANLEAVVVSQENLFPEGVEYSSSQEHFFLSSLTEGTVYQVGNDGIAVPFIEDERLVSSIGIQLDEQRDRLLVANSDPGVGDRTSVATQGSLAALGIYNVFTGEAISYTELGSLRPNAPHFANDIATDESGNAYVTDSFSPIIYQVDVAGTPSVFLEDERFQGEGFGLNGIVSHPDNFLIVAQSNAGTLFKVPLDNPEAFSAIESEQSFPGADGLLLIDDTTLLLVSNSLNQVFALSSDDRWESAVVEDSFATGNVFPTTATARQAEIFVLYAQLNQLLAASEPPSVEEFTIQQVGVDEPEAIPEPTAIFGMFTFSLGFALRKRQR